MGTLRDIRQKLQSGYSTSQLIKEGCAKSSVNHEARKLKKLQPDVSASPMPDEIRELRQQREKIKLEIPVVLAGEAPALKFKDNMLEHELDTLTIECFPAKIPASLEVDISSLTEPGQAIRVKDVALDEDITVLNDPELVVVKISAKLVEKVEEELVEVAEEEAGAPEEAPPGKETEEA